MITTHPCCCMLGMHEWRGRTAEHSEADAIISFVNVTSRRRVERTAENRTELSSFLHPSPSNQCVVQTSTWHVSCSQAAMAHAAREIKELQLTSKRLHAAPASELETVRRPILNFVHRQSALGCKSASLRTDYSRHLMPSTVEACSTRTASTLSKLLVPTSWQVRVFQVR